MEWIRISILNFELNSYTVTRYANRNRLLQPIVALKHKIAELNKLRQSWRRTNAIYRMFWWNKKMQCAAGGQQWLLFCAPNTVDVSRAVGRLKIWVATINVVGIICPLFEMRVKWSAKIWGCPDLDAIWYPRHPRLRQASADEWKFLRILLLDLTLVRSVRQGPWNVAVLDYFRVQL